MSILKAGLVAASLCVAASVAYADSSVPVQGLPAWEAKAPATTPPKMTKAWKNDKTPFSREAMEEHSGH